MTLVKSEKRASSQQLYHRVVPVGIGEYRIAVQPTVFYTVLGSCVSVCLYDHVKKIGGMTHILLPDSSQCKSRTFKQGKYADTAIKATLKGMMRVESSRKDIVAKMVGGCNAFEGTLFMGNKNTNAVKKALKEGGIKLLAKDINGKRGRHVEFFTDSGKIKIRMMKAGEAEPVKYL